jgi:MFS family permease
MLVKQIVGAVALAMVVGPSIVGLLIDRLRIRRVLITAAIIHALVGTAGLYLADLHSLLVLRLLVGFSAAAIQVACIALINTRLEGVARDVRDDADATGPVVIFFKSPGPIPDTFLIKPSRV